MTVEALAFNQMFSSKAPGRPAPQEITAAHIPQESLSQRIFRCAQELLLQAGITITKGDNPHIQVIYKPVTIGKKAGQEVATYHLSEEGKGLASRLAETLQIDEISTVREWESIKLQLNQLFASLVDSINADYSISPEVRQAQKDLFRRVISAARLVAYQNGQCVERARAAEARVKEPSVYALQARQVVSGVINELQLDVPHVQDWVRSRNAQELPAEWFAIQEGLSKKYEDVKAALIQRMAQGDQRAREELMHVHKVFSTARLTALRLLQTPKELRAYVFTPEVAWGQRQAARVLPSKEEEKQSQYSMLERLGLVAATGVTVLGLTMAHYTQDVFAKDASQSPLGTVTQPMPDRHTLSWTPILEDIAAAEQYSADPALFGAAEQQESGIDWEAPGSAEFTLDCRGQKIPLGLSRPDGSVSINFKRFTQDEYIARDAKLQALGEENNMPLDTAWIIDTPLGTIQDIHSTMNRVPQEAEAARQFVIRNGGNARKLEGCSTQLRKNGVSEGATVVKARLVPSNVIDRGGMFALMQLPFVEQVRRVHPGKRIVITRTCYNFFKKTGAPKTYLIWVSVAENS